MPVPRYLATGAVLPILIGSEGIPHEIEKFAVHIFRRTCPRGLSKTDAEIDHWMKDIAPTPRLRTWVGHRLERWPEFQARYLAELDANAEAVRALEKLCAVGPATLVFAARDTERNSAVVLKAYLEANQGGVF